MLKSRLLFLLFGLSLSVSAVAESRQAAIASAHPLATEAGFEILRQGGNAFDAAIAVSAALAVVEPAGSGLGGGGFWLLHDAATDTQVMLDSRETSPGAAHRDMYLDEQGNVIRELSLNGPLAAAIPGTPAAMDYLKQHYGQLPLAASLAPAIRYAEHGFPVTPRYQRFIGFRGDVFNHAAKAVLLEQGDTPALGTLIKQTDLAHTLRAIVEQGRDGFYQGPIAEKMVKAVQDAGGIWTLDDLKNYQLVMREPVRGSFAGYDITSAALPSAGGILMINMLNQLALFDYFSANMEQRAHLLAEVMRRGYQDRNHYLGDSDFVEIPDYLMDPDYAAQLAATIDLHSASHSEQLDDRFSEKGEDTTHFSIIDQYGNRVATTLSINYPFGSGFMVAGTGVLLNDEMDDFSAQSGSPNAYELVSESANAIAPGKRPLSSMTPTFVENDHRLMVTGTPGGSRIITMVLQSVLAFIEGKDSQQIVAAPRLHHQFLPDQITLESPGFSDKFQQDLIARGHTLNVLNRQFGNLQIITADKTTGQLNAASDPRGEGSARIEIQGSRAE